MGETRIADEKRKQVYEAFGFMEKFLDGRKWFCGEHLTIADLAILASLASIVVRILSRCALLCPQLTLTFSTARRSVVK
jgi:glutathione S-transferase